MVNYDYETLLDESSDKLLQIAIEGWKLYSHDFEELFDILKEYLYFLHCFTIAVKNCHDKITSLIALEWLRIFISNELIIYSCLVSWQVWIIYLLIDCYTSLLFTKRDSLHLQRIV